MKRIRKPKPFPKPKPVSKQNLPVLQELAFEVHSIAFFYVPRYYRTGTIIQITLRIIVYAVNLWICTLEHIPPLFL